MRRPNLRTFFQIATTVSLLSVTMMVFSVAHGQAAPISYKGITVTPAIVNIDLQSGQAKANFELTVTNNTKQDQVLTLSSIDFEASNQLGGLSFQGSDVNKHGLASWLDYGKEPIGLAPGESKSIPVIVDNRADLSPGGHYAAVLFKANSATSSEGANRVALNPVVSSLIFVRKLDGAQSKLELLQISTLNTVLSMPDAANITIKNTGNVQETPRGIVTITDPFSHEVSRGILNTDSNQVLPESTRLFQTPLIDTGRAWIPGKYTITVQYRYEGSVKVKQASATFWYINPVGIASLVVLVAIAWIVIQNRRNVRRNLRRKIQRIRLR